jgi:hypothetical protein
MPIELGAADVAELTSEELQHEERRAASLSSCFAYLYSNSSFFWTVLTEKRFMQNK